jgi:hypothetical protein
MASAAFLDGSARGPARGYRAFHASQGPFGEPRAFARQPRPQPLEDELAETGVATVRHDTSRVRVVPRDHVPAPLALAVEAAIKPGDHDHNHTCGHATAIPSQHRAPLDLHGCP